MARSGAPSERFSFEVSSVTESSRLCFSLRRAKRRSFESVSPNIRSKVTRGLIPTGSGLVSSRHDERIEERAGETVAGSHGGTHVLGAHFDGPQRRIAGHLIRDVLVDGFLRLDFSESVRFSVGAAVGRPKTIQERRTGSQMDR